MSNKECPSMKWKSVGVEVEFVGPDRYQVFVLGIKE